MKRVGYETDFRILNAVDFGIPQNRKRIILVGWNKKSKLSHYPNFQPAPGDYRVADIFSDLPHIKSGTGKLLEKFSSSSKLLQNLGIVNPNFPILMDHVARPNTKQDLEIYTRAVLAKKGGQNIRYADLPRRLKTHKNENIFEDRFKVVDDQAKGSQTVVAHIAKDGHFYIHPDIKQNRSLTVREAARLQTFPDDYKFEGSRGPQFRQIGNAVPPMLSVILAKELIRYI